LGAILMVVLGFDGGGIRVVFGGGACINFNFHKL